MTEEDRKARRVSREEQDAAWLRRHNPNHYTQGMYDEEDCHD